MNLKEKLQKIWKNRDQIAEGIYNKYLSYDQDIKDEAERRLSICRQNTCGWYDKEGITERVVVKGQESCGGCGCNLSLKTNSMQSDCYLKEIDEPPLWEATITEDQNKEIETIRYNKQFEKKQ